MSEINIANAWQKAEETCFTSLVEFAESKINFDAFLGWLPADRDCWMFSSGGLSTGPIERFSGMSPAWCALSFRAKVQINNQDRTKAMEMAGKVLAWLQHTVNMSGIGNVLMLRLMDLPSEPDSIVHESGRLIWVVEIPLDMTISTTTTY